MVDELQRTTLCTIALCANQPIPFGLRCDEFGGSCQAAMDAYVKVSEDAPLSYLTTPWTFDEEPAIQGWQCLPLFDSDHWNDLQVQGKKLSTADHPRPFFGILNGLLQCAENETRRGDPILLELQLFKIIALIQDVMGYDPGELGERFQELKDEELNLIVNENIMIRYSRLANYLFQPGDRKKSENRWLYELFTQMVFRLQQRPSYSVAQLEAIIENFSESFNPEQKSLTAIYLQDPTDVLRERVGPFPNFPLEDQKIALTLAESSEKLQRLLIKTMVMLADEHLDMKPGLRQVLSLCRDNPAVCEHANQLIAADYLNGKYESGGMVFHKEVIPEVVLRDRPIDFSMVGRVGPSLTWLSYTVWSGREEEGGTRYNEGSGPAVVVGGMVAAGAAWDFYDRHYLTVSALLGLETESDAFEDEPVLAYPQAADADAGPTLNMKDVDLLNVGGQVNYSLGLGQDWRLSAGIGVIRRGMTVQDADLGSAVVAGSWDLLPSLGASYRLWRSNDGLNRFLAGVELGRMLNVSGCERFPAHAGRSLCLDQGLHATVYGQMEWGLGSNWKYADGTEDGREGQVEMP